MPIEFIPSFTPETWRGDAHGYGFNRPVSADYRAGVVSLLKTRGIPEENLTPAALQLIWHNHVHYHIRDWTTSCGDVITAWKEFLYSKPPEFEPGDDTEENDQTQTAQGT